MKSILIVEPDRAARSALRKYFENRGYKVYDCGLANEILPLVQRTRPAITLVAHEVWGRHAIARAVQMERSLATTVIFVTRSVTDTFLDQLTRLKVFSYIKRPATMAEVHRTVEFAIRNGARIETLSKRVDHLERSIEHKSLVDQAKAIVMDNHQCDEPTAYQYIRKRSMDTGTSLQEVAQAILDWKKAELGNPSLWDSE